MINLLSLPLSLPFLFDFFWIIPGVCNHTGPPRISALAIENTFVLKTQKQSTYNLITKNLSSTRDERQFRGTTLIFDLRQALVNVVDLRGFEPLTSSMPWRRSPSCATGPCVGMSCWYLSLIYSQMYAITGVPTRLVETGFIRSQSGFTHSPARFTILPFTLVAHRRVQSGYAASHQPATL